MAMDTGLIFHPYMRPERTARQTFEWGVQSSIAADKAGFSTMMISEHASQVWANIPNPELIIAAAALQTKNIAFAPMAHIDRKSTRLNPSHYCASRMPASA